MVVLSYLEQTYTTAFVLKTPIESEVPRLQKYTGPRSFRIWGPNR